MKQYALAALLASAPAVAAPADLQFFGDLYVPRRVLDETQSTATNPEIFGGVKELLATSTHNVVNLEGAVTAAFVTPELKRFLLKMPFDLPLILRTSGIGVATLANNHSMDFGYQGVFDSQVALSEAGILHTGAGKNRAEATRPIILSAGGRTYCILAYSRTLPQSFWATATTAGTASATLDEMKADIDRCVASGLSPIVSFHWGQEMSPKVAPYQRELARAAIDAGARLIVGHHPHRLQAIEFYKERPIFYSLGNFVFGSLPGGSGQEGMAVRLSRGTVEIVPLQVRNGAVRFKPRPLKPDEHDPVRDQLPAKHPCRWQKDERSWLCPFGETATSRR